MKLSTAHKIGRFFQYFVLILVGVIMIYPLVWMVGATFKSNEMGMACALAWVMFIAVALLTVIAFTSQKHWVYYAD